MFKRMFFLAAMLLIVRFTANLGRWLWLAGASALAMFLVAPYAHSVWAGAEFLNEAAFNWLGFISRKPVTEDYVPLIPCLGVMWWGMAAGQWLLHRQPAWLAAKSQAAATPLAWLGRWSLAWYMVHQPVLIGMLTALTFASAHWPAG